MEAKVSSEGGEGACFATYKAIGKNLLHDGGASELTWQREKKYESGVEYQFQRHCFYCHKRIRNHYICANFFPRGCLLRWLSRNKYIARGRGSHKRMRRIEGAFWERRKEEGDSCCCLSCIIWWRSFFSTGQRTKEGRRR